MFFPFTVARFNREAALLAGGDRATGSASFYLGIREI